MVDTKVAPYAPPATVLAIIRHYRVRDVPERIATTTLRQIGVTESLMARTIAALRFLGLVREDLTTTEQFRALRYASEDDYHDVLGRVLDAAYKDVLDAVELGTATDREINNAFIPFSPGGQRERMITLFLALAREAGWEVAASGRSTTPRPKADRPARPRQPDRTKTQGTYKPEPRTPVQDTPPALLFGVTDADIASLDEGDFKAVWDALGLVARARARSLKAAGDMSTQAAERRDAEREAE